MMHRDVFSLITGRLALATLFLTAIATESFGQLDERWTVTINGQTVRVEADGSFLIPNVSAPDVFGLGGPGTGPDGLADDLYQLTGVRTTGSGTLYVYSPIAVRITPNGVFPFPLDSLTVTPFAPPLPESITLQVGCNPSAPTECGPVFAVGKRRSLTVTAMLSDPMIDPNYTLPSKGTTYRTSNVNIARVVADPDPMDPMNATAMLVEGISPGVAFITATNGGATSVVKIRVENPNNLTSTTVEGFVRYVNGMAVNLADANAIIKIIVTLDDGTTLGSVNSGGADGFFSVASVVVPIDPNSGIASSIVLNATVTLNGVTQSVMPPLPSLTPVPGGITDAGIITIDIVCDTPWSTAFGPTVFELINPGPFEGTLAINAYAVFDDGSGPALYVGGLFNRAGGVPANDIAKWNGRNWEPVGAGIIPGGNGSLGAINAMAVVDLGGGPALYVVGSFVVAGSVGATHVAKWDGQTWSALGGGVGRADNDSGMAVAGFDDGTGIGMELYVGGSFLKAGGDGVDQQNNCRPPGFDCVTSPRIAKWNGTDWLAVGTGIGDEIDPFKVNALAVYDGGSGSELYAGGDFFQSATVPSFNIVRWNGTTWLAVGNGLTGNASDKVTSLTVFDDGSGAGMALFAGGDFFGATGDFVSRWDGTAWTPLGNSVKGEVLALAGLNDGVNPPILYASGAITEFRSNGPTDVKFISQWSGSTWSGSQTWDATGWSKLGTGIESFGDALAVFDDGTGPALYVGGSLCVSDCGGALSTRSSEPDSSQFGTLDRLSVSTAAVAAIDQGFVAKWQNDEWSALNKGHNDEVRALTVFDDDGSGANLPALYAGGRFTPPLGPRDDNAAPFPTNAIAKFDGTKWSSLGVGMDCVGLGCVTSVNALAVFDEDEAGSNPSHLFAGGEFALADNITANNIASWDGSSWSALAAGGVVGNIESLAVFDDDGPGTNLSALYVGGSFTQAGTVSANNVARWDGTNWSALGNGVTGGSVFAMAAFDDGSGSKLYVGGSFTDADSVPGTANLARWDGSTWSAVQSAGLGLNGPVYALTIFDDGTGPALYAGGEFLMAGGNTANRVAKWNGSVWSAVREGLGPTTASTIRVDTLFGFDDGSGSFLFAGGDFTMAPIAVGSTVPLNRLAKWSLSSNAWLPVGVSSQMGSDPGGGVDGTGTVAVKALAVFDNGTNGPALFAGGAFETAAGSPSSNIAKLGCR